MAVEYQSSIECTLGRPLTDDELVPAATLDALTEHHLAVMMVLREQNLVTTLHYLRAVVPEVLGRDARRFIDEYQPPSLPLPPGTYAALLGRPLTDRERTPGTTLDALAIEQRELALSLAKEAHRIVAFMYLRRIAPASTAEECQRLVDEWVSR